MTRVVLGDAVVAPQRCFVPRPRRSSARAVVGPPPRGGGQRSPPAWALRSRCSPPARGGRRWSRRHGSRPRRARRWRGRRARGSWPRRRCEVGCLHGRTIDAGLQRPPTQGKPWQNRANTRLHCAAWAIPERPRILFVEDEPSISEPFSKALTREGFEPPSPRTAARRSQLAERLEPDLVLLDLNLPDGDGRDVCRALRASRGVPIIILTARGTETDRIVGLELGADDYVVKPFSGAEVIARIRAVLRRASRAAEPDAPRGADRDRRPRTSTPPPAARRLDGAELELTRKEFDLLARSSATPAASSRART